MRTWKTEFPDYPQADMPCVPSHWKDTSWHNDSCPSFEVAGLRVWVDYRLPEAREFGASTRFAVCAENADSTSMDLLQTDDWAEVLLFMARRSADIELLSRYFSALVRATFDSDTLAEINRRNVEYDIEYGPEGACATHDFCDANALMYGAFCALRFEEPNLSSNSDIGLMSAAWGESKARGFA